ncbi:uncharacterized protein LOC144143252 [Haemaphysalis longicornis]
MYLRRIRSPPQFDETSDKWPAYQVRLEAFFEGNGITEDKKKLALLVTARSTHTVDVLSGRCAPDKALPVMAAVHMQRWALLLSAYDYVITHQPGKDNIPAYALSMLLTSSSSQPETHEETADVRHFGRGEPWTPASITSIDGSRQVDADGPEGKPIRRQSDHVKPRQLEHDQGEDRDSGRSKVIINRCSFNRVCFLVFNNEDG